MKKERTKEDREYTRKNLKALLIATAVWVAYTFGFTAFLMWCSK